MKSEKFYQIDRSHLNDFNSNECQLKWSSIINYYMTPTKFYRFIHSSFSSSFRRKEKNNNRNIKSSQFSKESDAQYATTEWMHYFGWIKMICVCYHVVSSVQSLIYKNKIVIFMLFHFYSKRVFCLTLFFFLFRLSFRLLFLFFFFFFKIHFLFALPVLCYCFIITLSFIYMSHTKRLIY